MEQWPLIPEDVVAWFRSVFASANERVCERLANVPNIRETSLDDGLIEALIPDTAPRLSDAEHVHSALSSLAEGASPTFAMIKGASALSDWPLETWAADLLLTCQVGQQFDDARDSDVRYFLERRSGPIGAALAASITLPGE
jgi:hypothetical protein